MTALYRSIDEVLLQRLEQGAGRKTDGSTCVNGIFRRHSLISHVGDSRCVIGFRETGAIEQVTVDHEPDLPVERERVEKKGGKVEFHKVWILSFWSCLVFVEPQKVSWRRRCLACKW